MLRKASHILIVLGIVLSVGLTMVIQSYAQALPVGALTWRGSNSKKASSHNVSYELDYLGYIVNTDLTITFSYRVKAYDKPINAWALYSGCFVRGALVGASEPVVYKPSINCLRFVKAVGPNAERVVTFTLRTGYYTSYRIGEIDYYVRFGSRYIWGHIQGPTPIPIS